MDNARCLGALLSVSVDMAHHIVAHFLLSGLRHVIIDILRVALKLVDLFFRDNGSAVLGKPQLHLRLRQRDPKPPPGSEFHIGRKNILHFLTCIPLRQRAHIPIRTHPSLPP